MVGMGGGAEDLSILAVSEGLEHEGQEDGHIFPVYFETIRGDLAWMIGKCQVLEKQ